MSGQVLKFYSQTPPNKYVMSEPTVNHKEEVSSCTDVIEVFLKIENGILTEWSFDGMASIVTTAAASVFGESVIGENITDILKKDFSYVKNLIDEDISPRRQRAAALGLVATRNAIHKYLGDGRTDDIIEMLMWVGGC